MRALIGAAFFLLSVYYVATTIARMAKAARDPQPKLSGGASRT